MFSFYHTKQPTRIETLDAEHQNSQNDPEPTQEVDAMTDSQTWEKHSPSPISLITDEHRAVTQGTFDNFQTKLLRHRSRSLGSADYSINLLAST